jgi:hypothetical protein
MFLEILVYNQLASYLWVSDKAADYGVSTWQNKKSHLLSQQVDERQEGVRVP